MGVFTLNTDYFTNALASSSVRPSASNFAIPLALASAAAAASASAAAFAVAAGSELAFARMIGNTTFTPHFNKWKKELDIPGLGEVRYTFNDQPKLRYTNRDNDSLVYILMADGMRHKTRRTAPA